MLPDEEVGVDEFGDALFVFCLQQQQHRTSRRTRTNSIPPAAAPIMIARLSSAFLPPGISIWKKNHDALLEFKGHKKWGDKQINK